MTIHDYQVLQRNRDGVARVTLEDGETVEVPTGGPYDIAGASHVLAGDIWVLAGQSNMEGVGRLANVETPDPFVHSFQSREEWAVAEEPLHWLGESPRFIHHQLWGRTSMPAQPDPRDPHRTHGAGLGLTFGKIMHARTGVPVGLIPSAHGGTSMEQWDPTLRDLGGNSLYGATYQRIKAVGGKVAGVLWYQGESDAYPDGVTRYAKRMRALIAAFRHDTGQPDLPFYYVQLGRFVSEPTPDAIAGWNGIRELQRRLCEEIPHTAVVSAIDLGLDDAIHIDTVGLKRLGKRLADVACGYRPPHLASVTREANGWMLRVTFENVRGSLQAAGRPAGFSLRAPDGRELPLIYKVTLDGSSALLHLTADTLPRGTTLWYGWGLDPYCNIADAEDAAVPAFGPLSV